MKIISAFVSTLDGKITKGNLPPGIWASKEDQEYFQTLIHKYGLIVMGSGTFDPKFISGQTGVLRIILTHSPGKYQMYEKPGKIEFIDASPGMLIHNLKKRGYTALLLVAGSIVTTEFLKLKLIDQLWVTLEPKLFGNGRQILAEEMEIDLQLLSIKKFNKQGTLLLKYKIVYR